MPDFDRASIAIHKKYQGKLSVSSVVPVTTKDDLSTVYTPGVAAPCREIAQQPELANELTIKGKTVAVISDGSAVLGLGNIGPEAALPVMEGKAALMKEFAGVDAFPLVIDTQDTEEIIKFVQQVAPTFAGVNLEDISAPRCFEVEARLQDIGIPVFHDDQHGTAIVVSAALQNAAKVVGKKYQDLKVLVVGAGAAGIAIAQMLAGIECTTEGCRKLENSSRVAKVLVADSKGVLTPARTELDGFKKRIAGATNSAGAVQTAAEAAAGMDVIIGVSKPNTISQDMVKSMADKPIVFALANPDSEITPDDAKAAGAAVVATGRSDFPNQINNALAFPGIFKAVITHHMPRITLEMKQAAARAIMQQVPKPTVDEIIPSPLMPGLADAVADEIGKVL